MSSVCVEDGGADGEVWAVVANDAFEDQGVQQSAVEERARHRQREYRVNRHCVSRKVLGNANVGSARRLEHRPASRARGAEEGRRDFFMGCNKNKGIAWCFRTRLYE